MNPTSLTWRGLTIGAGTRYRIRSLQGWEDRPPARFDKANRSRGHGSHRSPVWSDERTVTVEGWCWSSTERDQLLFTLQAVGAYGDSDDTEPLTVTAAGRTLTAGGQLLEARPVLLRGEWGVGRFGWLLQWRCPDPLRYGPPRSVPTGLPTSGGGIAYPLTYPLSYGALGDTGQITLSNAGTAPAPILFGVRGGLPQGWELSATGQRLTYPVAVPDGQVIDIDTAAGTVLVEGTASRRANLTAADWLTVPAAKLEEDGTLKQGKLTVQFTSLGGAYDPAAQLSATVQDTYW